MLAVVVAVKTSREMCLRRLLLLLLPATVFAELREGVIGDAGPDIEQPDIEQLAAKQPALTS